MIPDEPVLPVNDIQGDILAGFRKDHESFIFLRIVNVLEAKRALREILPYVSPLGDVAMFNSLFRSVCGRRGEIPGTLTATWLNIAFTASALTRLTHLLDVGRFADRSFKAGLARRAPFVGDPIDTTHAGHPDNWAFGGLSNPVDVVLLAAGDDPTALASMVDDWKRRLTDGAGPGFELVWQEDCHMIPNKPGREHFGFRDGISQPAVRGRLEDSAYLDRREIQVDPDEPLTQMYARRGQPLIWPGQFVLGLPRQRSSFTDPSPLPALPVRPAWANNGSLLVIRRLRQDVERFERFVEDAATEVARAPGFGDMTPDRLAAVLVGRWPSGAPVIRAPRQDNPVLGARSGPNNAFGYLNEHPPLPTNPDVPPDQFPAARPDPVGQYCPHGGHIRKMNPRDQDSLGGGFPRSHMILRRGLTFDHTGAEHEGDSLRDKGLMFACYQSSIRQGFEFLAAQWANVRTRPRNDPGGMDLLIGRKAVSGASRGRSLTLISGDDQRFELTTTEEWVTPTGGGYFFAPSISTLHDVLTR